MIRFLLLMGTVVLFGLAVAKTQFLFMPLLILGITTVQIFNLYRYILRTNMDLTRFFDALRFNDFSQSFSKERLGSGFAELNDAFDGLMEKFRKDRIDQERDIRYLKTLVDHVPVSLVDLDDQSRLHPLNNQARRLLDVSGPLEFKRIGRWGQVFARDLSQIKPGETRLSRIETDDGPRHLILSATQIIADGRSHKIVSLQDIQTELDETELATWQDTSRVLAHEIMNSVTPVASLARTAKDIVEDMEEPEGGLSSLSGFDDLKEAIDTIAKRSEGLMHFVQSYRQLTKVPPPTLGEVVVKEVFQRLQRLMEGRLEEDGIAFDVTIEPPNMKIRADSEMIDQALINLLINAADAVKGVETPRIHLRAMINRRSRGVIEVEDNGPGIPDHVADKLFLPFFTTKPEGTGVGLSLVRQIILSHKGTISAVNLERGGALFRIIL